MYSVRDALRWSVLLYVGKGVSYAKRLSSGILNEEFLVCARRAIIGGAMT